MTVPIYAIDVYIGIAAITYGYALAGVHDRIASLEVLVHPVNPQHNLLLVLGLSH